MTAAPTASSRVLPPPSALFTRRSFDAIMMPETAAITEPITNTEMRMRVDADTRPASGLVVAADGVDVPAVAGAAEHERPSATNSTSMTGTTQGTPSSGVCATLTSLPLTDSRRARLVQRAVLVQQVDEQRMRPTARETTFAAMTLDGSAGRPAAAARARSSTFVDRA